jgi:MoxR-like ATPase
MATDPALSLVPRSLAPRPDPATTADVEAVAEVAAAMQAAVETVIDGKPEVVRTSLVVLLAQGHLLLEDVPGVGKTMLTKALAASMNGTVRRIQFTPDLLPSDVTGVSVYNAATREFEFKPGAVFSNVLIADEINRASPKTQSALLECMEEDQVTVDGVGYPLPPPFLVVATQNPVEMEGTYPLPEAQRDRFTARLTIGYPSPAAELDMIDNHGAGTPLDDVQAVTTAEEVSDLIATVETVHVADEVRRYVVDLVTATRRHPDLRLGASPRATLHLVRTARAAAALDGRPFVLPDDVQALAPLVLSHRLLPTAEAQMARRTPADVVDELLRRVPLPGASSPTPPSRRGR